MKQNSANTTDILPLMRLENPPSQRRLSRLASPSLQHRRTGIGCRPQIVGCLFAHRTLTTLSDIPDCNNKRSIIYAVSFGNNGASCRILYKNGSIQKKSSAWSNHGMTLGACPIHRNTKLIGVGYFLKNRVCQFFEVSPPLNPQPRRFVHTGVESCRSRFVEQWRVLDPVRYSLGHRV